MTPPPEAPSPDAARDLLRHTLATLAYRGAKILRGAPSAFAGYRLGDGTRTPAELLAHIGDLLDWAGHLARGVHKWRVSAPLPWEQEVARCFESLGALDRYLASEAPMLAPPEQLFQGPIADALTHFGQLALLRRRAGAPVRGENYFKADIRVGRVGLEQAPSRTEFD